MGTVVVGLGIVVVVVGLGLILSATTNLDRWWCTVRSILLPRRTRWTRSRVLLLWLVLISVTVPSLSVTSLNGVFGVDSLVRVVLCVVGLTVEFRVRMDPSCVRLCTIVPRGSVLVVVLQVVVVPVVLFVRV